jgi:two-component system alkaline phosphatase synthesis response regulator PhoP
MSSATAPREATERTILVVDDDAAIRDTLAYNLRADGYQVVTAGDGLGAMEAAAHGPVSLVLLDLMLPRLDGLEVCRRLRAQPSTATVPILMLTARGEETDKVVGLELGADDYVTKPFTWTELRARVRALLRRSDQAVVPAATDRQGGDRVLTAGELTIDLDRREVLKGDRIIELQARLFDLLVYLVRNRGRVVTRDQVLTSVWEYQYTNDTRTIDVHIRWLREKLEDDPANPQMIQTVRGVGYRFK